MTRRPGLPIGSSRQNLAAAVAGETHEYTDMYPGMAKQARDEGFDEIADWFETLAKAERSHANRYPRRSTRSSTDAARSTEQARPSGASCPLFVPDSAPIAAAGRSCAKATSKPRPGIRIDWQNPDFYDEASALKEMERVFDICHGCRRCVSLCQSFPNLFDLVDATADGEVHGVAKEAYWSVVDQCYLCDLCYMTKCPYTPPHAWNLDFPHLMLRAKAIKYKKGEVKAGEKFLASTDLHGQFAGIPIVVQAVNAINRTKTARKLMDGALGVHPDAWMPELAAQRFRWGAAKSTATW